MKTPRNMYDAGARDQKIEIEITAVTKTKSGAPILEGVSSHTAWAFVREVKAQTDREDGAVVSSGIALFVIRFRKDLKESDAIVWKGVKYTDLAFRQVGDRNQLLEITAKRRKGKGV